MSVPLRIAGLLRLAAAGADKQVEELQLHAANARQLAAELEGPNPPALAEIRERGIQLFSRKAWAVVDQIIFNERQKEDDPATAPQLPLISPEATASEKREATP
jgi:hypothetical protein